MEPVAGRRGVSGFRTPEAKAMARRLLVERPDLTFRQIGKRVGATKGTVGHFCRREGLRPKEVRVPPAASASRRRWCRSITRASAGGSRRRRVKAKVPSWWAAE